MKSHGKYGTFLGRPWDVTIRILTILILAITSMSHPTPQEDAKCLPLFGGSRPWTTAEWTAQDDRVRGGVSVSYLIPSPEGTTAVFSGNLDTKALGGAGFASQRTTEVDKVWDLMGYEGIEIVIVGGNGDNKTTEAFTFVMKNVTTPIYINQTTGRLQEESTISHEATFRPHNSKEHSSEQVIFLPFKDFNTTYRGRIQPDAPPIDLSGIRQFSIMVRSFFGEQSGPFQLTLVSISAVTRPKGSLWGQDAGVFYDEYDDLDGDLFEEGSCIYSDEDNGQTATGWWRYFFG